MFKIFIRTLVLILGYYVIYDISNNSIYLSDVLEVLSYYFCLYSIDYFIRLFNFKEFLNERKYSYIYFFVLFSLLVIGLHYYYGNRIEIVEILKSFLFILIVILILYSPGTLDTLNESKYSLIYFLVLFIFSIFSLVFGLHSYYDNRIEIVIRSLPFIIKILIFIPGIVFIIKILDGVLVYFSLGDNIEKGDIDLDSVDLTNIIGSILLLIILSIIFYFVLNNFLVKSFLVFCLFITGRFW